MFNKFPKRTGIYHIKDNIEYFEIKLYFRYVNSLLQLPKFYATAIESKPGTDTTPCSDEQVQLINIKWQEKLFSAGEVELYAKVENCSTDIQKKYHQLLLEQQQKREQRDKQSSGYTDAASGPGHKSKSQRKRNKKQQKAALITKVQGENFNETENHYEIFTYIHEDHFKPTAEPAQQTKQSIIEDDDVECMYIYAALKPDTQLIAIKWFPQQRQLYVYPDFNKGADNPYFIEIDSDYRHLYSYNFEHCSKTKLTAAAVAFPNNVIGSTASYMQILPEIPATTHWQAENQRNLTFAMPPKRSKRIVLLFEISKAENFEYPYNLHVRYHVRLPANTLLEEGLLEASTHASTASRSDANATCHFGYNWQLTLLCEEDFSPSDLVHVYFELISIDSWERERLEGYAHYSTYLNTGYISVSLQCLRPADSLLDALNRHFIGGRQKFDFEHFFTNTAANESLQFHNRYHCRMLSTGQLHLTCQRFTQSNCELLQPCVSTHGMTLDDIMLAYREACNRLEAIVLK